MPYKTPLTSDLYIFTLRKRYWDCYVSPSSPRRLNCIYKGRIFYRIIFFISSTLLLPLLLPFCPVIEENSKYHSAV